MWAFHLHLFYYFVILATCAWHGSDLKLLHIHYKNISEHNLYEHINQMKLTKPQLKNWNNTILSTEKPGAISIFH